MERRGKPLEQYVVDQIRRLRREGLSIRAIEQLSGCGHRTVQRYTEGIPVPGKPQRTAPSPGYYQDDAGTDQPDPADQDDLDALFSRLDTPPNKDDPPARQ